MDDPVLGEGWDLEDVRESVSRALDRAQRQVAAAKAEAAEWQGRAAAAAARAAAAEARAAALEPLRRPASPGRPVLRRATTVAVGRTAWAGPTTVLSLPRRHTSADAPPPPPAGEGAAPAAAAAAGAAPLTLSLLGRQLAAWMLLQTVDPSASQLLGAAEGRAARAGGGGGGAGPAREPSACEEATVSVADDGSAGVGATAAAAVSVALAQSWAAVAGGRGAGAPAAGAAGGAGRARFKLVAAVPRSARRPASRPDVAALDGGSPPASPSASPAPPADALDSIEDDEAAEPAGGMEATWRASGAHLKLHWLSPPRCVLVVAKPTPVAVAAAGAAAAWLLRRGARVLAEPDARAGIAAAALRDGGGGGAAAGGWAAAVDAGVASWDPGAACPGTLPAAAAAAVDLVATFGGDGTVLWAASLFGAGAVPPVVAFALGSLGFMTPFPLESLPLVLARATATGRGLPLMLRHRLQCRIVRRGAGSAPELGGLARAGSAGSNGAAAAGGCGEQATVLNEVAIDRGAAASLAALRCYVDRNFVTAVAGDGLIVATPSGSTAYSLAAGGSMVHPGVPCILFTPICAHALSSRPLVFPEHVTLRVKVPEDSRAEAFVSFDGRGRTVLRPGDAVVIRLSAWPAPMVCALDASHDWFLSVRDGLQWNVRKPQKNDVVVSSTK